MKLELKHLAPYLPYDLKVMDLYDNKERFFVGYSINHTEQVKISVYKNLLSTGRLSSEVKPILRPLSDLKTIEKEIKLVDSYWYVDDYLTEKCTVDKIYPLHVIEFIPYAIMQVLLKYHFDVFGLIEKGLAIDINTI